MNVVHGCFLASPVKNAIVQAVFCFASKTGLVDVSFHGQRYVFIVKGGIPALYARKNML